MELRRCTYQSGHRVLLAPGGCFAAMDVLCTKNSACAKYFKNICAPMMLYLCNTMGMKKPRQPTEAKGIRLVIGYHHKLHALRIHHGAKWLEKVIDRYFKKIPSNGEQNEQNF